MQDIEHKKGKIYYSMGEVTEMFGVRPSLLRYWEQEFDILKPHRNKKGNRLYTPQDVDSVKVIYHLLKEKKMKIEVAKKHLKENKKGMERDAEIVERLMSIRAVLQQIKQDILHGAPEEDEDVMIAPIGEAPQTEPMKGRSASSGSAGEATYEADTQNIASHTSAAQNVVSGETAPQNAAALEGTAPQSTAAPREEAQAPQHVPEESSEMEPDSIVEDSIIIDNAAEAAEEDLAAQRVQEEAYYGEEASSESYAASSDEERSDEEHSAVGQGQPASGALDGANSAEEYFAEYGMTNESSEVQGAEQAEDPYRVGSESFASSEGEVEHTTTDEVYRAGNNRESSLDQDHEPAGRESEAQNWAEAPLTHDQAWGEPPIGAVAEDEFGEELMSEEYEEEKLPFEEQVLFEVAAGEPEETLIAEVVEDIPEANGSEVIVEVKAAEMPEIKAEEVQENKTEEKSRPTVIEQTLF